MREKRKMSEYMTSQQGNLLIIILPLALIISKILMFLKGYIKNSRKIVKRFNHIAVIFTIISTTVFYINKWGDCFCTIWSFSILIYLVIFNFMYRKIEYLYNSNPSVFEMINNFIYILLGLFIISLSDTKIINIIGSGHDTKVDLLLETLIYIYGMLLIFLDNHIILFYNKVRREIDINRF